MFEESEGLQLFCREKFVSLALFASGFSIKLSFEQPASTSARNNRNAKCFLK
jgi:hypothetical protein